MKKIAILALLFLNMLLLYGRQSNELLTFTPAHPAVGSEIAVTYNAGHPDATLKDAPNMTLQLLVYREEISAADNTPAVLDAPMKKEGDLWKGTVKLDEPKGKFLLIRVASGDKYDDNQENCWGSLVYGSDGKPVRDAYLLQGAHSSGIGYYLFTNRKKAANLTLARADFEQERALYPDNWKADLYLWDNFAAQHVNDADKSPQHAELDKLLEKWGSNPLALYNIFFKYLRLGDSVKAHEIRMAALKAEPEGLFAQRVRWQYDILGTDKPDAERFALMEKYFQDFSNLPAGELDPKRDIYVRLCEKLKEYDKAYDALSKMKKQDGSAYNGLSWPLIEKGEQLEKAVGWAKRGVDLSRNPDPAVKPWQLSARQWEEQKRYSLGAVLDTWAYGLLQLGKNEDARDAYKEAYEAMKGEDPDVNARYVECLVKTKEFDQAILVGDECIKIDKASPRLIELVQDAIVAGEQPGAKYADLKSEKKTKFEGFMEEMKKKRVEAVRKKLVGQRISKPSVDFTLSGMDGAPVTLSTLQGKVVIVDFWATWCGPCKSSFPYVQKVYDKYKSNPNVQFLCVNSWERVSDAAAQHKNVEKFIAENKYTFPVLYDVVSNGSEWGVISKYEVEGIPTKFIIDKKGNIAWKSVGFDGPGMEEELTQQIEMLLADTGKALD